MSNPLPLRILGIDPGLNSCGWGLIDSLGNRLSYVASGTVRTLAKEPLADRLATLFDGLTGCIAEYQPAEAAIEQTFVNANPMSALRLGFARGVAMLAPAKAGLIVAEYGANLVKKTVSGYGHADKTQIQAMIGILLPGSRFESADAADALAIAICHAHHRANPASPRTQPRAYALKTGTQT